MTKTITKAQRPDASENTRMVVHDLVGEHAMPIILFLQGKEKISEFIIAEELGMEINEVRNILYRLLEHNLVSFLRKKDRIKGWYICYWDYHPYMVPQLKHKILENRLTRLRDRLSQEEGAQYYICRGGCQRLTFDGAMEVQFKCGECGQILQEQDNTRTKEFLREQIGTLELDVEAARPQRAVAMTALEATTPVRKAAPVKATVAKPATRAVAVKKAVAKKAPAAKKTPAKKNAVTKVLKKVFAVAKRR